MPEPFDSNHYFSVTLHLHAPFSSPPCSCPLLLLSLTQKHNCFHRSTFCCRWTTMSHHTTCSTSRTHTHIHSRMHTGTHTTNARKDTRTQPMQADTTTAHTQAHKHTNNMTRTHSQAQCGPWERGLQSVRWFCVRGG